MIFNEILKKYLQIDSRNRRAYVLQKNKTLKEINFARVRWKEKLDRSDSDIEDNSIMRGFYNVDFFYPMINFLEKNTALVIPISLAINESLFQQFSKRFEKEALSESICVKIQIMG